MGLLSNNIRQTLQPSQVQKLFDLTWFLIMTKYFVTSLNLWDFLFGVLVPAKPLSLSLSLSLLHILFLLHTNTHSHTRTKTHKNTHTHTLSLSLSLLSSMKTAAMSSSVGRFLKIFLSFHFFVVSSMDLLWSGSNTRLVI